MGLGQYNSPGEYCGPHFASHVFLIFMLYMMLPAHTIREILHQYITYNINLKPDITNWFTMHMSKL